MKTDLKKFSPVLFLVYMLIPIIAGAIAAIVIVNPDGPSFFQSQLVLAVLVALIGYIVVFCIVAPVLFQGNKKRMDKECKAKGCDADYFFWGKTTLVAVDTQSKKMGLLFRMNPFTTFVLDLDEVTDAKSCNGASALNFGGTREVYFTFRIGKMKFKVPTFTANTTCSLKSQKVMEAIAKADRMVSVINA